MSDEYKTHYVGDSCVPPHEPIEDKANVEFGQMIADASKAFDASCQERHVMGAKKYGPVNFMEVNSLQMAMEEVVDLANYARYTYIKLFLLNKDLGDLTQELETGDGETMSSPNKLMTNAEKFRSS